MEMKNNISRTASISDSSNGNDIKDRSDSTDTIGISDETGNGTCMGSSANDGNGVGRAKTMVIAMATTAMVMR
eukprot:1675914-Alexandrium_andersonii.AAC.1